jgi:RNA polymerase sporulation-specific sigma factor
MLSTTFMLLIGSALMMLRLGENTGSFPRPLKPAEEKKYLALAMAGDIEARNILIEHNLRLVVHIMKKYYTQTADAEDLVSIGTIGLIKGVTTYRPEKGVRLATYASKCIENEILMYFRSQKKTAGDISLSDALDSDGEGSGLSLLDTLSQDDDMLDQVSRQESCSRVREAIERLLTPREAAVVWMRYGLGDGDAMPQREVAGVLGISRSYVSRIEKKAIEKLRDGLEHRE